MQDCRESLTRVPKRMRIPRSSFNMMEQSRVCTDLDAMTTSTEGVVTLEADTGVFHSRTVKLTPATTTLDTATSQIHSTRMSPGAGERPRSEMPIGCTR